MQAFVYDVDNNLNQSKIKYVLNKNMTFSDAEVEKCKIQYKLEPPEGSWGYVVTLSMAVMSVVTAGPMAAFGIIYGKYLATIGDEGSATAIVNCIFNTVCNFMGLIANNLLKNKRSCRFVGVMGFLVFFLGSVSTIFASSLGQLIVTIGILQGVGFGLMLSSAFTSFNEYFIKRKNSMMGASRTLVAAATMAMPFLGRGLIDEYGYLGTIAILSALSLNAFVAMLTLHPVKWHMINVPDSPIEMSTLPLKNQDNNEYISELPMKVNKKTSRLNKFTNSIAHFLELSLLKDSSYVNISVAIALSFTSDMMFLSLLPMFLNHMAYNHQEIAYLMTVYMAADLLGRILLSLLTAVVKIKNRILFLCGTVVTAIFRIAFTINSGEWTWVMILIVMLGLSRCIVQVTVPLVLAEYPRSTFPAAFGLYLAICGVTSQISGQLLSLITLNTTGDTWVQHFLTIQLLLCVFSWTVEIMYNKVKK